MDYAKRTHLAIRYSRAISNPWISSGITQSSAARVVDRKSKHANAILIRCVC